MLSIKKGIEVGHIFELGNKYSEAMNLSVQVDNKQKFLEMGCYGIGVSRIVAASIEQNFDSEGIIFPKSITPFDCTIISINEKKSEAVREKSIQIYSLLKNRNLDIFYEISLKIWFQKKIYLVSLIDSKICFSIFLAILGLSLRN